MKSPLRAFSLIEIVLALGIVAFAVVGIMGMLPVAMKSAQESQRETRAAQIARRIFDELQSLPGTNTALIRGPSITNAADRIMGINLANPSIYVLGYDEQGHGLTANLTAAQFSNAIPTGETFYVAKVDIRPEPPPSKVTKVEVQIEAPAMAASGDRSRFRFLSMLSK